VTVTPRNDRNSGSATATDSLSFIGPFHADVSVRVCTSCPPLLITSKQKGCGYCCKAPFRI